jgi:hypothetical protein
LHVKNDFLRERAASPCFRLSSRLRYNGSSLDMRAVKQEVRLNYV